MALTRVGVGTTVSASSSATPTYPSGYTATAGDFAVIAVVSGHPSNAEPGTPSGWTWQGTFKGGHQMLPGTDVGSRRVTFFTRPVVSSMTLPAVAIDSTSGAALTVQCTIYRADNKQYQCVAAFGEDTVVDTQLSMTTNGWLDMAGGDMLTVAIATPQDSLSMSNLTVGFTPAATGTLGSATSTANSNGDDLRATYFPVEIATGGAYDASMTVSATQTASGTAYGVGAFGVLRVRESGAILFSSVGSTLNGATSVTPTYGGTYSPSAGELGVLAVFSAHPSDAVPDTPTGWTQRGTMSGGHTGAFGPDTGLRRLTFFTKVLTAGEPAPAVTIASGTGVAISAQATALRVSNSWGYAISAVFGSDSTVGTTISIALQAQSVRHGDQLIGAMVTPQETLAISVSGNVGGNIMSNPDIRPAGATVTSVANANGNDLLAHTWSGSSGGGVGYDSVTTLTATQTATGTAYGVGVGGLLRVRAVPAADPAMSTLTETFSGSGLPSDWIDESQGYAAVSDGVLSITTPAALALYNLVGTRYAYAINDSSVFAKVVPAARSGTSSSQQTYLMVLKSPGNWVAVSVDGNTLVYSVTTDDAETKTAIAAYNATTMPWWRIRHDGLGFRFGYSSDGANWTETASITTAGWVADGLCRLALMVGKWATADPAGTGTYDNINTVPPPAVNLGDGVAVPAAGDAPSVAWTAAVTPTGIASPVTSDSAAAAFAVTAVTPAGIAAALTSDTPTAASVAAAATPTGINVAVSSDAATLATATADTVAPSDIAAAVTLDAATVAWSGTVAPASIAAAVASGDPSGAVAAADTAATVGSAAADVALGEPTTTWSAAVHPAGINTPTALDAPSVVGQIFVRQAAGWKASTTSDGVQAVSPTLTVAPQDGDLVMVGISVDKHGGGIGAATITADQGTWTQVGPISDSGSAGDHRATWFWRIWHTGDATNLTFTCSASVEWALVAMAYAGVSQTTPVGAYASGWETGSATTTHTTSSITPGSSASWVGVFFGDRSGSTWAAPSGYTMRATIRPGGSPTGINPSHSVHDSNAVVAAAPIALSNSSTGAVSTSTAWWMIFELVAHGQTGTQPPQVSLGPWCGNVTDTSATVMYALSAMSGTARLQVSTAADLLTAPVYGTPAGAGTRNTVKLDVAGLSADTVYHYGIEADGVLLTDGRGSFRTDPTPGTAASFSLAFGSCQFTTLSATTFEAIRAKVGSAAAGAAKARRLIHMGDIHYRDWDATHTAADILDQWELTVDQPLMAGALTEIPMTYQWDNHDWGGNGSHASSPRAADVAAAYRTFVPSYPLPATDGRGTWQTWVIGRIRFIQIDPRSQRDPNTVTDSSAKTMLGAEQKAWFKARLQDPEPVKIICGNMYWRSEGGTSGDRWSAYMSEWNELTAFINNDAVGDVMVIFGDTHALVADDGSTATTGGIPQAGGAPFQQGALDETNTWSHGAYDTAPDVMRAYGWLDIADDGTTVTVAYSGITADDGAVRVSMPLTFGAPPAIALTGGIDADTATGAPSITFSATTTPDGLATGLAITGPSTTAATTATPDGLATGVAMDAATATVTTADTVTADSTTVGVSTDAPTLTWVGATTPDGLATGLAMDAATATVTTTEVVNPDALHTGVSAHAPTLTWAGATTPDGMATGLAIIGPSTTAATTTATPDGLAITVAMDAATATVTTADTVTADSTTVGVSTDAPSVTFSATTTPAGLDINAATATHTAAATAATTPDGLATGLAMDAATATVTTTEVVNPDALHAGVSTDVPTLTWAGATTPDGLAINVATAPHTAAATTTATPDGDAIGLSVDPAAAMWASTAGPTSVPVAVAVTAPTPAWADTLAAGSAGVDVDLGAPTVAVGAAAVPAGVAAATDTGQPSAGFAAATDVGGIDTTVTTGGVTAQALTHLVADVDEGPALAVSAGDGSALGFTTTAVPGENNPGLVPTAPSVAATAAAALSDGAALSVAVDDVTLTFTTAASPGAVAATIAADAPAGGFGAAANLGDGVAFDVQVDQPTLDDIQRAEPDTGLTLPAALGTPTAAWSTQLFVRAGPRLLVEGTAPHLSDLAAVVAADHRITVRQPVAVAVLTTRPLVTPVVRTDAPVTVGRTR